MWAPRGSWYSRCSPSSPVTKILRCCLATSPYFTAPSISVMTAGSFGRRASNSSTTRGRPPVMSLVLAVSRGILASMSPGVTSAPSSTIRWAPEGSRYFLLRLALLVLDLDARLLLLVGRLHDDERRHAGVLVDLLVHGLAVDDVLEGDLPALLGEDRERVRVPLDQQLALLDLLAVLDLELGAVDHGVALALAALLVVDDEGAGAVHHHQVALLVLDRGDVVELDDAGVLGLQRGLLGACGWPCRRCGTCAS